MPVRLSGESLNSIIIKGGNTAQNFNEKRHVCIRMLKSYLTIHLAHPVKLFRRRMQNYATICDKFIQHYATLSNPRRYIAAFSPPYCRERPFLRR